MTSVIVQKNVDGTRLVKPRANPYQDLDLIYDKEFMMRTGLKTSVQRISTMKSDKETVN